MSDSRNVLFALLPLGNPVLTVCQAGPRRGGAQMWVWLMFWSRNCTPSWEVTAPSLIRIQGPGQSPRPGARRQGIWTLSYALGQVTSFSGKWAPISPIRMRGLDSAKDEIPHSSKHLMCVCMLGCFSRVWLFETPRIVARQAPLSMGFSRQEYWSGLPCSPPGNLPHRGVKPEASCIFCPDGRFFTCEPLGQLIAKFQELFIPTYFFVQVNLIGCNMVKISLHGQTCCNLSFLFIFYSYYFLFVCLFCHTVQHSTVSLFPKQGSNPHPLEWKHRVLSTGLPGNSLIFCYYNLMYAEWDALFQMFWWHFYSLKWSVT